MASEEQHAAAVIAALEAANPYEVDDLKELKRLPDFYTEVTLSPRFGGGPRRQTAQEGTQSYRIITRYVATRVASARELRRRTKAALQDVCLTIDGERTTPIQFETGDVISADEGYYSGADFWTYTL
jgi:hypothetical protein